ncbi:MAG: hypothetical protein AAFN63_01030 [Pseudomonadota bacterium]
MKYMAAVFMLLATPAWAHHEVVVATTMVPLMTGLAVITVGVIAVVRKRLRNKR